jgi:hypothetical protein
MTCNYCGRDINYCDRYGCREVNGVAWATPPKPTYPIAREGIRSNSSRRTQPYFQADGGGEHG